MIFKAGFFVGLLTLCIVSFQQLSGGFYSQGGGLNGELDPVAEIIEQRNKLEKEASLEGLKDALKGVSTVAEDYLPSEEEFKDAVNKAVEKGEPIVEKIRKAWRAVFERQKKLYM